jgi:hypothetical protein
MDEADRADENREYDLRESMILSRKPSGPAPTGRCFYCDEIVGDHERWCNTEHRQEWERENNLRMKQGRL